MIHGVKKSYYVCSYWNQCSNTFSLDYWKKIWCGANVDSFYSFTIYLCMLFNITVKKSTINVTFFKNYEPNIKITIKHAYAIMHSSNGKWHIPSTETAAYILMTTL